MTWKDKFKEDSELILATSSKNGEPNAIIAVSLGFMDDKLIFADCHMNNTIKNIKENPLISVVGGYYRVNGKVELFQKGKYYDYCVEKSEGYKVKNAVVVNVNSVFELDKMEMIYER